MAVVVVVILPVSVSMGMRVNRLMLVSHAGGVSGLVSGACPVLMFMFMFMFMSVSRRVGVRRFMFVLMLAAVGGAMAVVRPGLGPGWLFQVHIEFYSGDLAALLARNADVIPG
jgi:hypothetical protein